MGLWEFRWCVWVLLHACLVCWSGVCARELTPQTLNCHNSLKYFLFEKGKKSDLGADPIRPNPLSFWRCIGPIPPLKPYKFESPETSFCSFSVTIQRRQSSPSSSCIPRVLSSSKPVSFFFFELTLGQTKPYKLSKICTEKRLSRQQKQKQKICSDQTIRLKQGFLTLCRTSPGGTSVTQNKFRSDSGS